MRSIEQLLKESRVYAERGNSQRASEQIQQAITLLEKGYRLKDDVHDLWKAFVDPASFPRRSATDLPFKQPTPPVQPHCQPGARTYNYNYKGLDIITATFLVFIVLKLSNVIDWAWWWVLAPLWGTFFLYATKVFINSLIRNIKNK